MSHDTDRTYPWVEYRHMIDILELREDDPRCLSKKAEMNRHPLVSNLISELSQWTDKVISSHKSAGQPYHKLVFLAELGIRSSDGQMSSIVDRVIRHVSSEGLFQLPMQISLQHGGTNELHWAWALCDAPLLLYAIAKIAPEHREKVKIGLNYLLNLHRQNGWPCVVSQELGKFRGPGKKDDPCPYATLVMLKLIAHFDELKHSQAANIGIETLLSLWQNSWEKHPYMFYMGTDFRKIKAPLIWYDILHVTEVLSRFDQAASDPRFREMLATIQEKSGLGGMYTPESIWTAWGDWDFGNKREPSPWISFLVHRIEHRIKQYNSC